MASIPADHLKPPGLTPKSAGTGAGANPTIRPPQKLQESYSSESSINNLMSESPSHYSSFSSSDSDEPLPGDANVADEDAVGDVVGVSIGRAQSRMKARTTPAEEKTRVLEQQGGYFTTLPDPLSEDGLFISQITAEPESVERDAGMARVLDSQRVTKLHPPAQSIPAEHRTPRGPHTDLSESAAALPEAKEGHVPSQRASFTRSLLKTSLPRRPRAWSGELKRLLPDLGSLAKRPSLSFRSGIAQNRARSQTVGGSSQRNSGLQSRSSSLDRKLSTSTRAINGVGNDEDEGDDAQPISELRSLDGSSAVKHSYSRRPSAAVAVSGRPPSLRRSSSDHSLYLRASSTASSLEQRPRYENIHSQVNSRFKAIKDSLQDSGNRLFNMPALHLQDIRGDWSSRPFFTEYGVVNSTTATDKGVNETSTQRFATPPPPPRAHPQSTHPILEEAMSQMTGDVVILGGYRGSILRSAKPPHRQLWVPMKVGLNLRKVDLEVGLNPEDEERMEETIIPSGVLSHIGPVDVCRRLMKRLYQCDNAMRGELRVWDYGYDWRLSPELLSRRLIAFLEGLPCNRVSSDGVQPQKGRRGATVIAHSLGGLITRHAVNQRPDLFAGVLYAGVPQHCVNILGPLRNGDDVLLSSRVLSAQVNFSFRTSFAFLPIDGQCFIDKQTNEEYRVDFFDAHNWDEYRLSPCINPALPTPTAGRGFKDFALIGKRFSMGARDEPNDFNINGLPDGDTHTTSTEEDITACNPPRTTRIPISSSNPTKIAAAASDKAHNAISLPAEGLFGPVAHPRGSSGTSKASTTSTIPRAAAMKYLQRTLAEVKRFRSELDFQPEHQSENRYPPTAVLYGKSVPTVYGARVPSREGIKHQYAYDDLAFAAGDGVCLASAAMLPPGYRIIRDGLVKCERGHVGLLGDLEGVGQCLRAIQRGRREGVGLGSLK